MIHDSQPEKLDLSYALKALHQRPIAYYPAYAKLMESVAGGVALSQLLFHWARHDGDLFCKVDDELQHETGISEWEMNESKRKFKKLKFLQITRKGVPARTWYEVDAAILLSCLSERVKKDYETLTTRNEESSQQEVRNPHNYI